MRVFLIAGEPSGDKLGGALMRGLRSLRADVKFDGVGGAEMQAAGLQSRFPMQELSVMGIAEILPKYRALKRRVHEMAQAVIETQPDVLVTIDAPEFSFRVAKLVKASSQTRTVHYVAPTVWAWRPGRAEKISGFVDHLLALFPFEPPYFTRFGMACDFVGHPVAAEPVASDEDVRRFREAHALGDSPVLLVLPGSRQNEVRRLAEIFGKVAQSVSDAKPKLKVVVPAATPVADAVKTAVQSWPVAATVLDPRTMSTDAALLQKRAAFKAADIALAASGTVSLELAAAQTPMVIAYRMHWLSHRLIKALALVDTVTLVNLVSETRVVPEFLGPDCQVEPIAEALRKVVQAPQEQIDAMDLVMARLGKQGENPGLRAARAVVNGLG